MNGGLGFRWLRSFNIALLAKQCWRILKSPESLCSRILKAKYFNETNFLDAPSCSSPSFFWKGLEEVVNIFRGGLYHRVGTEENIKIWEDNWIPTSNSKKPLLCLANLKPLVVAELIDPLIKDWHRPTLHRYFMPNDVTEILKLKINYRLPPDDTYWGMTRSGVFSMKSCYFLTEFARFAGKQVPSSSGEASVAFKQIWELSLPPKIKQFCWKLLRGILPTTSLLLRRGIGSNSCCRYCGNPEENDLHTLWKFGFSAG
ncbi:Ribonuclease H-like superfamily protein [Euphorbia peplus]|nr:Ribonuclease H-like superfamily protein [Euphorbia peplus]